MTDDLDLLKIARKVAEALRAAAKDGVTPTPDDIDAVVREDSKGRYGASDVSAVLSRFAEFDTPGKRLGGLAGAAVQGATFNWSDEIVGAMPRVLGGGAEARETVRLRNEAFRAKHPVAEFLAAMAGGAATAVGAPVSAAKTVAGGIARGAATGGGVGAVSGAGAGEDRASRKRGAVVGGTVGTVMGGAIPTAIETGRSFVPSARATRRVDHAISRAGGAERLSQRVDEFRAAGRGEEVMLADLDPRLRAEADFAANNSDDVLTTLGNRLETRQRDASERLLDDVNTVTGERPNGPARINELAASRRTWADGPTGYGGLREGAGQLDIETIAPYFATPQVQSAWRQAQLAGDISENSSLAGRLRGWINREGGEAERPASFDDVLEFKRVLDGKVREAYTRGNGALAKSYETVRNASRQILTDKLPNYAAVEAQYAARKTAEESVQQGMDWWSRADNGALQEVVRELDPQALDHFRYGMASGLVAQLQNSATNRGTARQIANASRAMQSKLRLVFGSQERFDEFMQRVETEAELGQLSSAVGGSQTARRLQARGFDPAALGIDAVTGNPAGAVSRVMALTGKGALDRNTAARVGPTVMTQGADALETLLRQWKRRPSILDPMATRILPTVGGLLGGR